MDNIKTQLDRLTELSDEQIEALETQIIAEFETLEASDHTPESVEAMMTLADFVDQVRGESQRREALSEELSTKAVEAAARIRKEEPNVTEEPEVEEAADEAADEPIEASAETETTEQAEPVEASADTEEAETATESLASEEAAPEEETVTAAAENDDDKTQAEEKIDEIIDEAEKTEEPAEEPKVAEDEDEEFLASNTEEAAAEAGAEDNNTINTTTDEPLAQEEEATVTAAANEEAFEAPADRRPKVQEIEAAPVAITAGADIPGYSAGQNLSKEDVSQAFLSRLKTLSRVSGGGDGEQYVVASLTTEYPEDRVLGLDSVENQAKIDGHREAIVAAGGYGGVSVAPNYDIFDLGASSARPVRDSLPRFAADRGSVRYIVPPSLADYEDAVGVWTAATDANPGSNTKPVLVVEGATERTADLYAVTLQLQIGNFMARALPELVDRHNELALVQHSRIAELELLKQIDSYSTQVTAGKVLGVARDFLVQMRKAAAAYRSRHRIERDRALQAILPEWVVQAIAADLTMQMPGDDTLSVGLSTIEGYLSALNVRVTVTPDIQPFGAQGAGALLDFPSSFEWFLFSEGTFIFLDGGTLDLGIIRDSTLVGTNDYRMFVETFEGLGYPGVESLAITSTFAVTGEAAALTDTTPAP